VPWAIFPELMVMSLPTTLTEPTARFSKPVSIRLSKPEGHAPKTPPETPLDAVVKEKPKYDISEETKKEIIGAIWRAMPEGIKNRHNITEKNVITIVATEEKMLPEMIAEGEKIHKEMLAKGGSKDV